MTVLARLPARGRQAARARSAQTHPPTAYIRRRLTTYPQPQVIAIGVAVETDEALSIAVVQPGAQVIAIGVAVETDTALSITVDLANAGLPPEGGFAFLFPAADLVPTEQIIPIGIAVETDIALPITVVAPSAQVIEIGVAIETDLALPITRLGGSNAIITMNMQMPPGTLVGAYRTHEWIGHLVPMRRAGSYHGPVVEAQDVDEYGEVTFLSLAPGEYVAWAEDFPLRRRFFVITD